jgi:hypothetical protein
MNLTQLRYFVRVAEMGSFSKAAIELDVAQPALSRQVRLLETDLHVTLLQRTGRGVLLTDAGKRLFDHAVGILQLVAHAREDLGANRDEATGRIVVGLPPSMGRMLTLPLVDAFRQHVPKERLAIVEGLSAASISGWCTTPTPTRASRRCTCSTSRCAWSAPPRGRRASSRHCPSPSWWRCRWWCPNTPTRSASCSRRRLRLPA